MLRTIRISLLIAWYRLVMYILSQMPNGKLRLYAYVSRRIGETFTFNFIRGDWPYFNTLLGEYTLTHPDGQPVDIEVYLLHPDNAKI